MSEETDPESKTEEPTEKRREDARSKGEVLRSRDFGTAAAILSTAAFFSFFGLNMIEMLAGSLSSGLTFSRADITEDNPWLRIRTVTSPAAAPMIIFAGLLLFAAVGGQALLGALRFNFGLLKPDAKRLNPLTGLGRIFGKQGLVELVKSLCKISCILAASSYFLNGKIQLIFGLANTTPAQAMRDTASLILSLLFLLGGVCLLLAGGDIFAAFMRLQNKLRMSHQEIKEEHKQSEGSPEAKQYRRRRQREILKSNFRAAVKDANVVVTNPLHFAVALRYERGKDKAPVVLAKGRDLLAEALRDIATEKKIPILPSPKLARALYFTGKKGTEIHRDLYHAVAAVLAFIFALDAERKRAGIYAPPDIELPEHMRFDTQGKLEL